MGAGNRSAVGTLVERSSRYVLLLHLPDGHDPAQVNEAMADAIEGLPAHLRRSITWDQGREMRRHVDFTVATGVQIYFCDPHSPWQRGSNENTNGLLRQWMPKGTDLHQHSAQDQADRPQPQQPPTQDGWDGRLPLTSSPSLLRSPLESAYPKSVRSASHHWCDQ